MVTELIKAVNHFTGKFKQPIKLEVLAAGAAILIDVASLVVIGLIFENFCLHG